ncbi:outer membrane beta-barrel protein [Hymenobacter properus]|uniref:TonB-dependent receptor n=1 Tax=Hymenobacter properus TaxID=2791026 RepID=A0A931BES7_9BACT|nr:outer membrane beta-barrel protein [Hymenobacter properus]MBF9140351.1 TonB-dependent receptor [Hymenobacter properus]MBR7719158.1 TonB-dependent receptor [Microvirga sp. SRT04]
MPLFLPVWRHFFPFKTGRWISCLLLATPLALSAQSLPGVSGTVASPAGPPVEFATVTLHRAADSVVVKTEFSDQKGTFRLEALGGRRYLVSVSQVGFQRYWSAPFNLTTDGITLPAIVLATSQATALKEVTVTARKPLFEHQAGRTVVNVADSPLSGGATTLDVLGRSPGVTLDAGNNLGLRGRQGLLLVVDGKRVPLTGEELASYLRALPAEQVQSVELLTNPPAQYDAQGGAGVIAIYLKKDQRLGTNGNANASYGRGEYGKFTAGLGLNHRRKNVNYYGNYTYVNRRDYARQEFDRQYAAQGGLPAVSGTIAGKRVLDLESHSARFGADINLTKASLLGLSLTSLLSQTNSVNTSQTEFNDAGGALASRNSSTTHQDIWRPSGSANLNFRHAFADSAAAATLTADADFARYNTTRTLALSTLYQHPLAASNLLTGDQLSELKIAALKVDFSQPLPRRARLDMGAKTTMVNSANNVVFLNNGAYNPSVSTNFNYSEQVRAAYANLRSAAAKTTFQVGLRIEQARIQTELAGERLREQNYLQFFPSASVQRTLNAQNTLALTASRRIDRPNYGQLNPLRSYFDATSYRSGNPDLVAQTSYNFDFTYTFRQKFSAALSYAQTDKPIVAVVQPAPDGGRQVVNRDVNLTTQDYYALTLTAPLEPVKWWTLYANGVFYYSRFRGNLAGTALDRQQPACILTANNTFNLPRGWSGELNGTFQSGEIWGFERAQPRGQLLLGLQRSFWAKQATLRLNVADVLYTAPIRSTSVYDSFTESFRLRQDTRVATAAFTYRFGSSKVAAARKRAAGADDELRRAGGS